MSFRRYLVKFLSKLAQDSEANKMTPSNIAIVLGPNLLWTKTEGCVGWAVITPTRSQQVENTHCISMSLHLSLRLLLSPPQESG